MARSLGFGSNPTYSIALFRLAFAAPTPNGLSLHVRLTRWPIIQKVRGHRLVKDERWFVWPSRDGSLAPPGSGSSPRPLPTTHGSMLNGWSGGGAGRSRGIGRMADPLSQWESQTKGFAFGEPPPTACRRSVSGLFHSPLGVLFTFPSRYLCAIGRQGVLRLGGWSPHVQTGFHVSRPTRGHDASLPVRGCHPLWPNFPDGFG